MRDSHIDRLLLRHGPCLAKALLWHRSHLLVHVRMQSRHHLYLNNLRYSITTRSQVNTSSSSRASLMQMCIRRLIIIDIL